MSDAAAYLEMSGSFVPVLHQAEVQSKVTLLEEIESSLPLMIVAGVSISVLSFAVMFALGMFFEATAFHHKLASMYPIHNVAIITTSFAALAMVATVRAGLRNDVPKSMLAGSLGALVLGVLAGAVIL